MLDKFLVKNLYKKIDEYPNISLNTPIGQAIHVMHSVLEDQSKYRTILVLDEENRLKGYLTLRDLIRAVGPDYLQKSRPAVKGNQPFQLDGLNQDFTALALIWQEGFTIKLHDELKKPVSEYMSLMEDRVSLEDPLAKCIYIMMFRDVLILPVVEDERVVGVIRLVDLFECIAENVENYWLPRQ